MITYTNLEYLGTSNDGSVNPYQKTQSITTSSAIVGIANNHAQTPLSVGNYFMMLVIDASLPSTMTNLHMWCGMGASGSIKYLSNVIDEYTGGSSADIVLSSMVKMTSESNCAAMVGVNNVSGSGDLTLTVKRIALIKVADDLTYQSDFTALKNAIVAEQSTSYTIDESESGGETEVTLQSISATYTGGNVTSGTALTDLTGITVTANYSDGSITNVTDYSLSGSIVEGNNTITVIYQGKTTTFNVTGTASSSSGETEVTLQSISAVYTGGNVAVGTSLLNLTGITVTATYSNGSTSNVTGYTLSGNIVEGNNTITVTYKGKTTTFVVIGVASSDVEKTKFVAVSRKNFEKALIRIAALEGSSSGGVNKLMGKKIIYDGDSICASRTQNGGSYPKLISDLTGCTYVNNAVAGASLASIGSNADSGSYTFPHSVVDNSASLDTDGDLYCFEGGINDYYHNVPLGTFDELDFSSTPNTSTIYGAMEQLCRNAMYYYVGKPICFILAHKCYGTLTKNSAGYTAKDVHYAQVKVLRKYGVPYYDAFEESGLNGMLNIHKTNYLNGGSSGTADGVHTNEAGYLIYYVPQLIYLFNRILPY